MKPKRNNANVPAADEIYTPASAVRPILPYLPSGTVWESSDFGASEITKVIKDSGRNVIGSHKKDGLDFFLYEPEKWDVQVTNPPYSIKDKWIKRSFELQKPFFLLLPLESLAGIKRAAMFKRYPAGALILQDRVNFILATKKVANWFSSMWLIGNIKDFAGRIEWIATENACQGDFFRG